MRPREASPAARRTRRLPSVVATEAQTIPTLFGGSVRVRTATGDRFDSTSNLPKAGWTTIGTPGRNKGYRFTSKAGPIRRVMVIPGRRVKVIGTGAFTATLSTNPNPVDVVLRTGAKRYCFEFGGVRRSRWVSVQCKGFARAGGVSCPG
jgi:hypothetical protein